MRTTIAGVVSGRRGRVGGLPVAAATGLIGRDRELEKVRVLLVGSARMVTLIGPGGIGKTRLAAEAVRRQHKATGVPVYWVRLARLAKGSDTAAVEEEIARSVVETDFSGRSAWQVLIETFARIDAAGRDRQSVLVLDNCEHVLTGVAGLVTELLDAVPGLKVVATSRDPIGWVDEYRIIVPPLTRQHAMSLFRQRAELTGYPLTGKDQTTAAAEICRHVHNHPLYIQLAAARLRHQPPAMILRGLTGRADDARLRWTTEPWVGADPRHRGVGDVIAWSYELCTAEERLLFERMSVFAVGHDTDHAGDGEGSTAGDVGADLDAIQVVCSDDQGPETGEEPARPGGTGVHLATEKIEVLLEHLVEHSLVTAHITPTTVRYSLLESLRVFAQERLRQRCTGGVDEPTRLAGRHRRYYRDKIAYAVANWFGQTEQDLLDWGRAEWDNILTAIETGLTTPGEAAVSLEICTGALALHVPFSTGSIREMRRWTERCLDATRDSVPQLDELRSRAMALITWICLCQGEHEDAERMLEDCVTACLSDPETGTDWRRTPDTDIGLPAFVEFVRGAELMLVAGDAEAITVLTRARDKFHDLGDQGAESLSELWAALAASVLGTPQQARALARHLLQRSSASGSPGAKAGADLAWSVVLTKLGHPAEALEIERTALARLLDLRDQWSALWAVQFRAWTLARIITDSITAGKPDHGTLRAQATEIAHLTGGTRTHMVWLGVRPDKLGPFTAEAAEAAAVARRVLGPATFATEEARGSRLRPELSEVQQLALGTLSLRQMPSGESGNPAGSREDPTVHWEQLTPAEQQVATLAASGWSNTEIAARRGKSSRTIDAQISAVFRKLAITTRNDIIEYVPRHVIDTVSIEATHRPSQGKGRVRR